MEPRTHASAGRQRHGSNNHVPHRFASDTFPVDGVDHWIRQYPWAAVVGVFSLGLLAGLWLD